VDCHYRAYIPFTGWTSVYSWSSRLWYNCTKWHVSQSQSCRH